MAEAEGTILKETLENQQMTIKKLQIELDEERKASASGAEEALSMILRLQEDKSTQKMEYLQYKRMMEEKLQHDEESLAILREIIFLKDTEIEALRYQIQGYKRKLLGACVKDPFPWFQNLDKKNVTLPAFNLEELCSEIDGFGCESFSNNFDGFEKKLFRNCKGRKFENLFRSKSSIKEIFTMDEESRFDSCPSVSLVKGPRRTSSVVMLRNPCAEPEFGSDLQDIFEIPESLKGRGKPSSGFSLNECDTTESNIEKIKLKIETIEREVGEMRETGLVSRETQLELLQEIRNKVNLIQYQMQQKDGEIQEERKDQQIQVSKSGDIRQDSRRDSEVEMSMMIY